MKKNRVLSRCYLGGYFLWLFGVMLLPLLCIYVNNVFALIMLIIALLDLATIIVSRVFYAKKRELFPLLSLIGHGVGLACVLASFIFEISLTASGKMGLYAIVIASICLFFYAIQYFFLFREIRRMKRQAAKRQAF